MKARGGRIGILKGIPMTMQEGNPIVLRLERISTLIEKITMAPCIVLGGAMVAVVMSGVFARYVVQNPMPWTEEVARFLMNWMALLGASIATRYRAHLGLLYFVQKFPMPLQRLSKLFMDLLIMVFLYLLSTEGIKMAAAAEGQIEPTTGITMNYVLICVPLCGALMFVQLLIQMIVDLLNWGTSRSPFQALRDLS
jgi:TRAP-type C4-dicarboxylate transport system permease small subunit